MVQQYQVITTGDYNIDSNLNSIQHVSSIAKRKFLTNLNNTGKPGSKRYQRFLNNSFLQEQEWDLQPEDWNIVQFSSSPFTVLFNEKNKRKWDPFVDITEEEQEQLLVELSSSSNEEKEDEFGDFVFIESEVKQQEVKISSPPIEFHFYKVNKRVRNFIRKNPDNPLFRSLDEQIVNYIQLATNQPKIFNFTQSFQRMMCHGVCQFYLLSSKSEVVGSGKKQVIVWRSKKEVSLPTMTLSMYLEKEKV